MTCYGHRNIDPMREEERLRNLSTRSAEDCEKACLLAYKMQWEPGYLCEIPKDLSQTEISLCIGSVGLAHCL